MAAKDTKNDAPEGAPKPETQAPDERLGRDRDAPRSDDRGGANREFGNREWEHANAPTDPERRRAFRERWSQTHLPNLPTKDGEHRCWVSTNHPTDTPARRIALGYRVLMLDDVKGQGWNPEESSVKDGSATDGVVRWREMIGMSCPMEMFLQYMREFHHDQPLDMARDIYGGLEQAAAEVRDRGGRIELGEGLQEMARHRRAPTQFEG